MFGQADDSFPSSHEAEIVARFLPTRRDCSAAAVPHSARGSFVCSFAVARSRSLQKKKDRSGEEKIRGRLAAKRPVYVGVADRKRHKSSSCFSA